MPVDNVQLSFLLCRIKKTRIFHMVKIFKLLSFSIFLSVLLSIFSTTSLAQEYKDMLTMETTKGTLMIELNEEIAPKHVERIKALAAEGFYDGVVFHRVIPGFMAQTGDPTGTGMGGSELADLPAEFTNTPFERGTLGMARSSDPNSANSQFFITFGDTPHLNGQYTVFGKVIEGMEVIDAINAGEPPADPDKIISLKVGK